MSNFFQKELAPYADQIDKENNFPQLRVSALGGRGVTDPYVYIGASEAL